PCLSGQQRGSNSAPYRRFSDRSLAAFPSRTSPIRGCSRISAGVRMRPERLTKTMAQPALDVFHALDQALAGAVAAAPPSVVHVSRSHSGGTGIVWAPDLVISSNFHTPDRTQIGLPNADGELDKHDAEVIGRDSGTDVALLRVRDVTLSPAKLRELDGL